MAVISSRDTEWASSQRPGHDRLCASLRSDSDDEASGHSRSHVLPQFTESSAELVLSPSRYKWDLNKDQRDGGTWAKPPCHHV